MGKGRGGFFSCAPETSALSLPMGAQASTRGTLAPDIWCKRLPCGGKGAKPSSDGSRLEASKV